MSVSANRKLHVGLWNASRDLVATLAPAIQIFRADDGRVVVGGSANEGNLVGSNLAFGVTDANGMGNSSELLYAGRLFRDSFEGNPPGGG